MNLMKKGLNIISKYKKEFDKYAIHIVNQPKFFVEEHIIYNNGDIVVHSSACPEWSPHDRVFYVQGRKKDRDNDIVFVSRIDYFRIRRAITDCNNKLCQKNKSSIY